MRGLLSAMLILLLTCMHGPLSASMPHDFAGSHHAGDTGHFAHHDHHGDLHVKGTIEASDSSSHQAPAPAADHVHLAADAVKSGGIDPAFRRAEAARRLFVADRLLVQEHLSTLLEPPIA